MLHGTRESFEYFECAACGCVQITTIPEDLSRFYPHDYFSFRDLRGLARHPVRRWIDPKRAGRAFGRPSLIGAVADAVSRPLDYLGWIREAGLGWDARVLDVGCGAGKTLIVMALGGFRSPVGVDAFVQAPLSYEIGVTVHKASLEAFAASKAGPFDLIMFHHALEHLPDPAGALAAARSLLSDRGRILVVIPVAGSYAWEHYREYWCNLDPPRHLHLLTPTAMANLSGSAALQVDSSRCVGTLSQFVGSERYLRDIPASDRRKDRRLFSRRQLARWRARTAALNAEGRGDQMMFFLRAA